MDEFEVMYYRREDRHNNLWRDFFDLSNQSAKSDGETYDLVNTYRKMGYEVVVVTVQLPK